MKLFPRAENIDAQKLKQLKYATGLEDTVLYVLLSRGIDTADKINAFLYPELSNLTDPFAYSGMKETAERLLRAVKTGEKILIYGDYDCDGIGASAILYLALKAQGIIADYYIPDRRDEGYGLNLGAVEKIKESFSPDLVITVDCGATSYEEIARMKELGIDVLVTDHHRCGGTELDCAGVNSSNDSTLTPLCGAGVVFQLVRACFGDKLAQSFLDICALSTVADVVPVVDDNRIIVKYGLKKIREGKCRAGIKELFRVSGTDIRQVNAYDIAFRLAPRLNASGRLASAYSSLSLLIEDDLAAINLLAEELELQNKRRQAYSAEVYQQAKEQIANLDLGKYRILVLYNANWNEGVLGIAAAKIAEEFRRPAILFAASDDKLKGSARSVEGVSIYDILNACAPLILRFGGHEMAAGLSIDKSEFETFREGINDCFTAAYPDFDLEKREVFDLAQKVKSFNKKLFEQLEMLEPYGQGNPHPVFLDEDFLGEFTRIGQSPHIRRRIPTGEMIVFNAFDKMDFYNTCSQKLLYTAEINYYNGREYNRLRAKEFLLNDSCLPDSDDLLSRHLALCCEKSFPEYGPAVKKEGAFPALYIAFKAETFQGLCKNFPDIERAIYYGKHVGGDCIVLCPDKDFPYRFYNSAVVLDYVSKDFAVFLRSQVKNIEINVQKSDFGITYNIDSLREDYVQFRSALTRRLRFLTVKDLYRRMADFGYIYSYKRFLAAYYTFVDLGLIITDDNGILSIDNRKVDLDKSELFRALSGE